ncbi:MAG: hypothetical protein ACPG4Y_04465 [Chitinophagales bacterium]
MKKNLLFIVFSFLVFSALEAQVGINILNPDSSAVLQLESTDRGLALPRMTSAQMNAIQNPLNSLTIYNTEDSLIRYWNGSCWLKTYQKNCNECEFTMTLDQASASIDHITTDSAFAEITVTQTNGNQDINLIPMAILPTDITMTLTNNVIDSFGVASLSIYANIFSTPGTYPIIIQAICGDEVKFVVFNLTVDPCLYVPIATNQTDLNLQTFGSLPGPGNPVCVIAEVFNSVEVNSSSSSNTAFVVGNLDPTSHVGIINRGSILGRGGDGGSAGDILSGSFGENGFDGGNALELTTKTTFDLQGEIYAGGGGGAGIGTGLSFPILGNNIFIGFGVGGGGGVANGLGGAANNGGGVVIGQLTPGGTATGGASAIAGLGGSVGAGFDLAALLGIPILYANLTGGLDGGNGGDYGQAGTGSNANIGIDIGLNIPIIGNLSIYQGNFPIGAANGGLPGLAIKTNSNQTINLVTPNLYIKGAVAP